MSTLKILLAADGSPFTQVAARHLVNHVQWFAQTPEIHVVHIQPPIPYASAAAAVGKGTVEKYQREESEAALSIAEKELATSAIPYRSAWQVGDVAEQLAEYVKKHGIDLVVMGSHGQGALANLALGSVATKCLAKLTVPVMVVPRASAQKPGEKPAAKAAKVPVKY
jgi:nucleotide-binding universal stress UspA family protein